MIILKFYEYWDETPKVIAWYNNNVPRKGDELDLPVTTLDNQTEGSKNLTTPVVATECYIRGVVENVVWTGDGAVNIHYKEIE